MGGEWGPRSHVQLGDVHSDPPSPRHSPPTALFVPGMARATQPALGMLGDPRTPLLVVPLDFWDSAEGVIPAR